MKHSQYGRIQKGFYFAFNTSIRGDSDRGHWQMVEAEAAPWSTRGY